MDLRLCLQRLSDVDVMGPILKHWYGSIERRQSDMISTMYWNGFIWSIRSERSCTERSAGGRL